MPTHHRKPIGGVLVPWRTFLEATEISPQLAGYHVRKGEMPAPFKVGGRLYIRKNAADAWLKDRAERLLTEAQAFRDRVAAYLNGEARP